MSAEKTDLTTIADCTQELVQPSSERSLTSNGYTSAEAELLRAELPELAGLSNDQVSTALTVNGKVLPCFGVLATRFFLNVSPAELVEYLKDDAGFENLLRVIERQSAQDKTRMWYAISALPFTNEQSEHLLIALGGRERGTPHRLERPEETDQTDRRDTAERTISRGSLAPRALPHLATFIANKLMGGLEPADARVSYNIRGSGERQLQVSTGATSFLLIHAEKAIQIISKRAKDSSGHTVTKSQDLEHESTEQSDHKNRMQREFDKLMRRPLQTVLALYADVTLHPESAATVVFSQYKRGGTSILSTIKENSQALRDLLDVAATSLNSNYSDEQSPGLHSPPPVIHLSPVDEHLGPDSPAFSDSRPMHDTPRWSDASIGRNPSEMNEWQQTFLSVSRATDTGEWTEAVFQLYLKYLDCMPQHMEHRLGALDVERRVTEGEITGKIKRIASVASGPHEELQAQWALTKIVPGYDLPEVWSLDKNNLGLELSRGRLPSQLQGSGRDVEANMLDAPQDVPRGSFDMVECSSFDNLRTNADLAKSLANMATLLRPQGVLRFAHGEPFSQEAVATLEGYGFRFLAKNQQFGLREEAKDKIRSGSGEQVLARCLQKLNRHKYSLLVAPKSVEENKLRVDLERKEIFERRNRITLGRTATSVQKQADNGDISLDYNTLLQLCCVPRRLLDNKYLTEKQLIVALQRVAGELDTPGAHALFGAYFCGVRHEGVMRVAPFALEAITSKPDRHRLLSCELLRHENKEVGEVWLKRAEQDPRFFMTMLLSAIPQEPLPEAYASAIRLLSEKLEGVAAIETWFSKLPSRANGEVEARRAHKIIPPNVRFLVPVSMRFAEGTSQIYWARNTDHRTTDKLSLIELKRFLAEPGNLPQKVEHLPQAIDHALEMRDTNLANAVINVIRGALRRTDPLSTQEQTTCRALGQRYWDDLMELAGDADGNRTRRLRKFGHLRLGVVIPILITDITEAQERISPRLAAELRPFCAPRSRYINREGEVKEAVIRVLDEFIYGHQVNPFIAVGAARRALQGMKIEPAFRSNWMLKRLRECAEIVYQREVRSFEISVGARTPEQVLATISSLKRDDVERLLPKICDFILTRASEISGDWYSRLPSQVQKGLTEFLLSKIGETPILPVLQQLPSSWRVDVYARILRDTTYEKLDPRMLENLLDPNLRTPQRFRPPRT